MSLQIHTTGDPMMDLSDLCDDLNRNIPITREMMSARVCHILDLFNDQQEKLLDVYRNTYSSLKKLETMVEPY